MTNTANEMLDAVVAILVERVTAGVLAKLAADKVFATQEDIERAIEFHTDNEVHGGLHEDDVERLVQEGIAEHQRKGHLAEDDVEHMIEEAIDRHERESSHPDTEDLFDGQEFADAVRNTVETLFEEATVSVKF